MKRFLPVLIIIVLLCGCIWAQEEMRDYRPALRQLVERADSGDAKSLYELATLHDRGFDTIPVDSVRSSALYLMAAEKGYAPAMNFIGFRYYKGEAVRRDIDSALYWIRKAGDAGDITAAANLGYLLTEGEEVPHDDEEAVKWLTIAAAQGVREAQFKLVDLMEDKWAALPMDSSLSLGIKYYTDKAPVVGIVLLSYAAEAGSPKAMALLGDAYSKGWGVPYDHQKAIDYFYQAAEGGDPSAQFIIAELLEFFPDNARNYDKDASYWYEQAAAAGVTDSETAYQRLSAFP